MGIELNNKELIGCFDKKLKEEIKYLASSMPTGIPVLHGPYIMKVYRYLFLNRWYPANHLLKKKTW